MKTLSLRIAACLAIGFSVYVHADGCEYDTQCKGDRICENGKCVSPQSVNQPSATAVPVSKPMPASKAEEHNSGIYGIFNKAPAHPAEATYFCCTSSDKLGPYPNPGSDGKFLNVGDACSGTSSSARMLTGRVCN